MWLRARVFLVAALFAGPSMGQATEPVGLVVAMRGQVSAVDAAGQERALTCGDVIGRDELIRTGRASRVAVLTGDVYAQLYVHSAARFGNEADGSARLALERGRMRVIDPRPSAGAAPVHVRASEAQTRFAGNDVDAYVLGPVGATNAMLCSESVDLAVERLGQRTTAQRGQCAIDSRGKSLYRAQVPSTRIALAEAYECELQLGIADLFDPTDVATRPGRDTPLPDGWGNTTRDACDDPGSGCSGRSSSGSGDTITPFPSDPLPASDALTPFPSDPLLD